MLKHDCLLSQHGLRSNSINRYPIQHTKLLLHFLLDTLIDDILSFEVLFDGDGLFLRELDNQTIFELIQPLQSIEVKLEVYDLVKIYVNSG